MNPPGTSPTPAGSEGYPAHLPPPGVLATCVRVVSWCVSMGLVTRRVSNVGFTVIDCFRMSESTLRYTSLDPYLGTTVSKQKWFHRNKAVSSKMGWIIISGDLKLGGVGDGR